MIWVAALIARLFVLLIRAAYGTPTDPVGATIITVAYAIANLLNPIRALRAFTGNADPPGSGYVVTSDSTSATTWKTGITAIAGVLGYTPVSKIGDSMSGALTLANNIAYQVREVSTFARAVMKMNASDEFELGNANVVMKLLATTIRIANQGPISFRETGGVDRNALQMNGTNEFEVGNVNNPLKLFGPASASSLAVSGIFSAASVVSGAITGASSTVTGLLKGSTLESTVATGTAPMVVASTTKVTNLNAALLDGLTPGHSAGNIPTSAGAGVTNLGLDAEFLGGFDLATLQGLFAKFKTGSYTGNAGTSTIFTGWTPKVALIFGGNVVYVVMPSGQVMRIPSGLPSTGTGVAFTATQMVATTDANLNATTYTYAIWG